MSSLSSPPETPSLEGLSLGDDGIKVEEKSIEETPDTVSPTSPNEKGNEEETEITISQQNADDGFKLIEGWHELSGNKEERSAAIIKIFEIYGPKSVPSLDKRTEW